TARSLRLGTNAPAGADALAPAASLACAVPLPDCLPPADRSAASRRGPADTVPLLASRVLAPVPIDELALSMATTPLAVAAPVLAVMRPLSPTNTIAPSWAITVRPAGARG